MASGQFFNIFKMLNQRERIYRKKCPKADDKWGSQCHQEGVETYNIVDQPFPFLILIDLNWAPNDLTSKNCLTVLASLPPFFFIPSIFEMRSFYDPQTYMIIYKLKSLIFFTGSHYFTVMRVQSKLSPLRKTWHLFNDGIIKLFPDWYTLVQYTIQANCCPTMVIYERHVLSQPMSVQSVKEVRCLLSDEQLLMLYLNVNELAEENVEHLMKDESLIKEQEELMR
mgnify:CR=1 FL=1